MIDQLLTSLSVIGPTPMSDFGDYELQFVRFSSLVAKRRYTLKSPALAFLKLNMYDYWRMTRAVLINGQHGEQWGGPS